MKHQTPTSKAPEPEQLPSLDEIARQLQNEETRAHYGWNHPTATGTMNHKHYHNVRLGLSAYYIPRQGSTPGKCMGVNRFIPPYVK